MPLTPLAQRFRELLAREKDRPADAQRKTGLSYSTVYEIYSGKNANPSAETMEAIASAYGVTVSWLLAKDRRTRDGDPDAATQPEEMHDLLGSFDDVVRHLSGVGAPGQLIPRKLAAIEGWERTAAALGKALPDWWWDIKRQVESGEL